MPDQVRTHPLDGPLRTTTAGHIDVYSPTPDGPDTFQETIDAGDVLPVELSTRWSQRKDEGVIRLRDDDAAYLDSVTSGDRLEFWVEFDLPTVEHWGHRTWGDDSFWGGHRLAWTAWVRDVDVEWRGPDHADLVLDCEDFVFGVLSKRLVQQVADDDTVVGTIFEAVDQAAPDELATTGPLLADERTTGAWQSRDGLDTLNDLLRRGGYIARARRDLLVIEDLAAMDPAVTVTPDEVGPVDVAAHDDRVANAVRVEGGTGKAVDDSHTPHRIGWRRLSPVEDDDDPYLAFEIRARKSEIGRLDLWTAPTDTGGLTVRIQEPDDDGNIDPDDTSLDIVSHSLTHHFLAHDGWTAFDLPSNELASPRPVVIVEADEAIQRVGVGPMGHVLYQSYHPYDIVAVDDDPESIDEHRRREHLVSSDAISSFDEALAVAREKLARRPVPEREARTYANVPRLHLLDVGTPVAFDAAFEPHIDSETTWLTTERTWRFDGDVVETDLSFAALPGVIRGTGPGEG